MSSVASAENARHRSAGAADCSDMRRRRTALIRHAKARKALQGSGKAEI